jgi:hypothetical protein
MDGASNKPLTSIFIEDEHTSSCNCTLESWLGPCTPTGFFPREVGGRQREIYIFSLE